MANNSVKPGGSICVGKIVSFICFISLLTIVPDFLKLFWPYVVDLPGTYIYMYRSIAIYRCHLSYECFSVWNVLFNYVVYLHG